MEENTARAQLLLTERILDQAAGVQCIHIAESRPASLAAMEVSFSDRPRWVQPTQGTAVLCYESTPVFI